MGMVFEKKFRNRITKHQLIDHFGTVAVASVEARSIHVVWAVRTCWSILASH